MAENIAEDIKHLADNTKIKDTSTTAIKTTTSCEDESVDNTKSVDIPQETKEENIKNIDLLDSKEQQNVSEADCNNSKEEPNIKENASSEEINKTETIQSNSDKTISTEEKSKSRAICEDEEKWNEILKVVHGDLNIKDLQKPINNESKITKSCSKIDSDQTVKTETVLQNNATEDTKEFVSAVVSSTDEEKDSKLVSEKTDEISEIGIVGPPTAVSELINEEELRGDSNNQTNHVVEWVENSIKTDRSNSANTEEESNIVKDRNQYKKKNSVYKKARRKKLNDAPVITTRKSQKIVSNIIKKSIKW